MERPQVEGRCRGCGAVEVLGENGESYFMQPKTYRQLFGGGRLPRAKRFYHSCDHCVNHWGVDLCACGSGEPPEKCQEGFPECGEPMQVYGGRTQVRASDAWGE